MDRISEYAKSIKILGLFEIDDGVIDVVSFLDLTQSGCRVQGAHEAS